MTDDAPADAVPVLDDEQSALVEAFTTAEAGLFTANSNPGAGKSTLSGKAIASQLCQQAAAGHPAPEQTVLVATFGRADAASIVPTVVDWLHALHARDAPVTDGLSSADIDRLVRRVQQGELAGTIDSVLRDLLRDIASECGFDAMPSVGNKVLLSQLRRTCYDWLTTDAAVSATATRLAAAYPGDEYAAGLAEMLDAAVQACQQRQWDVATFEQHAHQTIETVYDGDAGDLEALTSAIRELAGADAAATFTEQSADTRAAAADADAELHAAWTTTVADFATVLEAYWERYRTLTHERGVIDYPDCAALVAEFFTAPVTPRGERLIAQVHERLASVVIDETQDMSPLQHAALSPFITDDMRVLLTGDRKQCIYAFRHAHPRLFEQAVTDRTVFDIEWTAGTNVTTRANYRSRPEIVDAINAVAERTLTDATQGACGADAATYPSLDATRPSTAASSVHVATFSSGTGTVGASDWVSESGEAATVARFVSAGLADGTLVAGTPASEDDADGPSDTTDSWPDVTVLFRRRADMAVYQSAFEAENLPVTNAAVSLFATSAVRAVLAVCRWLRSPTDAEATATLVQESALACDTDAGEALCAAARDADWDVAAVGVASLPAGAATILDGLQTLVAERARLRALPAARVVTEIIDTLQLPTAPLRPAAESRGQRLADLDALCDVIRQWEGDDRYTMTRLCTLLAPLLEEPGRGPDRPTATTPDTPITFKTIHQMKGDEADVVVLANPTWNVGPLTFAAQPFMASGEAVGLAPPWTAAVPDIEIPGFEGGLYNPTSEESTSDVGLRWPAEQWMTDADGPLPDHRGRGPRYAHAMATRREAWRLLFVAMSRARDHFVVPLPEHVRVAAPARDHWVTVLRDVFGISSEATTNGSAPPIDAAVDAPNGLAGVSLSASTPAPPPALTVTDWGAWLPRFVSPTALQPLSVDPARYRRPYLLNDPLETYTDEVTAPLSFESLSPATVGTAVHELVHACIREQLTPADLRTDETAVATALTAARQVLDANGTTEEIHQSMAYLRETVIPQLAGSGLLDRVDGATTVYQELALETLVELPSVSGPVETPVTVELHGRADLVLQQSDGTWTIEDVKLALTDGTRSDKRYQVQLASYERSLAELLPDEMPIATRLTTLGEQSGTHEGHVAPAAVTYCLQRLQDGVSATGSR